MLRLAVFAGLAALNLGSMSAHADTPAADCQAHFTSEGSLFAGKKFTTWVEFSNLAKPDAYSRALTAISKDGYQIVSADKESGIISASQSVSFGKGTTAPLVIVVEPSNTTGSKLTATFRIGGGQTVKAETVRAKLCEYLGAGQPLVSQVRPPNGYPWQQASD
jgi:hypothetical protein